MGAANMVLCSDKKTSPASLGDHLHICIKLLLLLLLFSYWLGLECTMWKQLHLHISPGFCPNQPKTYLFIVMNSKKKHESISLASDWYEEKKDFSSSFLTSALHFSLSLPFIKNSSLSLSFFLHHTYTVIVMKTSTMMGKHNLQKERGLEDIEIRRKHMKQYVFWVDCERLKRRRRNRVEYYSVYSSLHPV